ncbi:protein ZNRD2 [Hydra vulgaris]|uniref:Sjoegren syndrome/scleroderma autoantigen 1 n=1 Tax=Hydra vulgaris TaxID=6087 RepID=T2MJ07_HYDVU|nr:protein ZNRD2 isoform X2 [Hydra vulgaris]
MCDLPELSDEEKSKLKAKRDRSNKISKLMGDYLLKGYKMLGTVCQKCQAILMQNKQQEIYCVGCEEVDKLINKDAQYFKQQNNISLADVKGSSIDIIKNQITWATDQLSIDTLTLDQRQQFVNFIKLCCETRVLLMASVN